MTMTPGPVDVDVAALFHVNTAVQPFEMRLDVASLPPPIPADRVLARVRLPPVSPSAYAGLEQTILHRATLRDFDPRPPLSLQLLARLLVFSGGFTRPFLEAPELEFHRATPSAGATYPVELFPIVLRVSGLRPGAYRYVLNDHSLELHRPGRFGLALPGWTLYQPYVANASVVFVLAGDLDRIRPRYGERGYRYMLFEAGHVAQNLCLVGSGAGLGVLAIGGFVDAAINRLLGLDGLTRAALYLVAVGVPRGST